MKLRDILTRVNNKSNHQINWSLKKKKLKKLDMSEDDILDMKITKQMKDFL